MPEELQSPLLADDGLEVQESFQSRVERLQRNDRCLGCLTCGVVFSLLVAIAFPLIIESQVQAGIRGNVVIDSFHADGFAQFQNRGKNGNDFMEFYFFNITNPHEMLNGEKPVVEELGPFMYDSFQIRGDFEWNKEADTLAYREHSYYVFNADLTRQRTNGRFDNDQVKITTLNMLFLGMEAQVGKPYWHIVCDYLLWKDDFKRLFSIRPVVDYLVGYEEKIDILSFSIPIKFPGLYPNTSFDEDPNWQMKTTMLVGAKNISNVYEIISWRGMDHVKIECPWGTNPLPEGRYCPENTPCCKTGILPSKEDIVPVWGTAINSSVWDADANLVHGRNGEQFAPDTRMGQELIIFNDIIWRALRFKNHNNREVSYEGIKMLRFSPDDATFMNSTMHPSNKRYYLNGRQGILGNLSMIEQGCTLFATLPHFLNGDPSLLDDVIGLNPDPEKHTMFIDVEPTLGQTMIEHVRAQVNGQISRDERWWDDDWFPNVRDQTLIPIAWFDQVSIINEHGIKDFKQIYTARAAKKASIILGSIASVLFVAPLALALRTRWAKRGTAHDDDADAVLI